MTFRDFLSRKTMNKTTMTFFKDVFQLCSRRSFLKFLLQSGNELLVLEMQKKEKKKKTPKIGDHRPRFRDNAYGQLPLF